MSLTASAIINSVLNGHELRIVKSEGGIRIESTSQTGECKYVHGLGKADVGKRLTMTSEVDAQFAAEIDRATEQQVLTFRTAATRLVVLGYRFNENHLEVFRPGKKLRIELIGSLNGDAEQIAAAEAALEVVDYYHDMKVIRRDREECDRR